MKNLRSSAISARPLRHGVICEFMHYYRWYAHITSSSFSVERQAASDEASHLSSTAFVDCIMLVVMRQWWVRGCSGVMSDPSEPEAHIASVSVDGRRLR